MKDSPLLTSPQALLLDCIMRCLGSLLRQFCPSSGYTALHIHQQIEVLIPVPSCAFHMRSEIRLLTQKQRLKSPLQAKKEEFKLSSQTITKVLWLIHMLLLNLTQTGHQLQKLQAWRKDSSLFSQIFAAAPPNLKSNKEEADEFRKLRRRKKSKSWFQVLKSEVHQSSPYLVHGVTWLRQAELRRWDRGALWQ